MSTCPAECHSATNGAGARITIDSTHFIGSGSHAWLIVGSIPGADIDHGYLVLADDEEQAQATFRNKLFSNRNMTEEDSQGLIEQYETDIMYNQINCLS